MVIDSLGSEDIFEEIPAILIVIVASFVFLMSVAEGFTSYSERKEDDHLDRQLDSFFISILSYEPLLFDSTPGRFDSSKLDDIGRQKVAESFRPELLGFHYNLTLLDVSLYESRYDWFAGEESADSLAKRTESVPVIVSDLYGQHHSALMEVSIWV
jgi:hypothetical protein